MQTDWRYFKESNFVTFGFWDFYTQFSKPKYYSHFQLVKLEKVIKQRKSSIIIDDEKKYKRCRVQLYGNGVVLRDITKGSEIKTKKQQLSKPNDFLVAEIDAKFGGYGIVPDELENAVVSSHYFLFEIDQTKLSIDYLRFYLKTIQFSSQVKATGSTNYSAIRPYHVLDYLIALPPLEIQQILLENYNQNLSQAEANLQEAEVLEKEIEGYLLEELGISFSKREKQIAKLQFIELTEIERWDTTFLLNKTKMVSKFSMMKLDHFVKNFLSDSNNESLRVNSSNFPDDNFYYLGMENVEKNTGEIVEMPLGKGVEIKSQTIKIPKNYVIYGKLRPYLNKYWSNQMDLENIICSSEFFVFSLNEQINQDFFLTILSSAIIQTQIKDNTSGARMPRMNENTFLNLEIPFPSLQKQQEIPIKSKA